MGTLTYDSKLVVQFDDRVLAHLQAVIWSKLRRGENFSFTWTDGSGTFGRSSIWLSPTIPLAFEYFGGRPPKLNTAWTEVLTKLANSASGLTLVPEPPDPDPLR